MRYFLLLFVFDRIQDFFMDFLSLSSSFSIRLSGSSRGIPLCISFKSNDCAVVCEFGVEALLSFVIDASRYHTCIFHLANPYSNPRFSVMLSSIQSLRYV